MKLIIDDNVYNYRQFFSQFGEITQLKGSEINNHPSVINCDILIVRSQTIVNQKLLQNSRVQFVGSVTAGINHVDCDYLARNNIKFAHAKGSNANAVAEYVIAAILNLANTYNFDYKTRMLGIIGVGNIGSNLQKKAEKLGINVLLNDPPKAAKNNMSNFVTLDYLLKHSDIISLHTPLTKSGMHPTFKLLNNSNFELIKKNAIIINTARGEVVDEKLLFRHNGIKIIDSWHNEPNINKALINKTLLATPHIAGHTIDAKYSGSLAIYHSLCDFLKVTKKEYSMNTAKVNLANLDLLTAINKIYNFKQDDDALRKGYFENYRRNYPKRYEWHNYGINL